MSKFKGIYFDPPEFINPIITEEGDFDYQAATCIKISDILQHIEEKNTIDDYDFFVRMIIDGEPFDFVANNFMNVIVFNIFCDVRDSARIEAIVPASAVFEMFEHHVKLSKGE